MLEEPHAGARLGHGSGDLLGSINRDRLSGDRSMKRDGLGATGSPNPQGSVDAEVVEVSRTSGNGRFLDARTEALAIEEKSWPTFPLGEIGRDAFDQQSLCLARHWYPIEGQERREQAVADCNRSAISTGEDLKDVDRSGVRITAPCRCTDE
jgi:hypothetical protein